MSKAFTKESDENPDEPIAYARQSQLPPGAKNYMTTDGARRLREELDRLTQVVRPEVLRAASSATGREDAEVRQNLKKTDRQIQLLSESLNSAEVVDPSHQQTDQVRFGATVTVRDQAGAESTYRIVGVDEIDVDRGWVSWLSPIAKALLNKKLGDAVALRLPAGEQKLQVMRIEYERL